MDANMDNNPFMLNANSPHIFDADMTDTSQTFEPLFFDQALEGESPLYGEHGYPASPFRSSVQTKAQSIPKNTRSASNENGLSVSSESSTQDSSSDSSGGHKRQTSSRSSHSLNPVRPTRMAGAGNRQRGNGHGTVQSQGMYFGFGGGARFDDVEYSNRAMEAAFDFDSAANTPSPLTSGSSIATSGPSARFVAIPQDSPMQSSAVLQPSSRASMDARDNSPLAQMTSPDFQTNAMHNSHTSPASSDDFLDMTVLDSKMPTSSASQQVMGMYTDPTAVSTAISSKLPSQFNTFVSQPGRGLIKTPSQLIVHPTPQKSRVETQIPIKMSLFPMPRGVKRLHLPPQTISKPKLLAKPPPKKEPDMLELTTSLVCTSAMQDAAKLKKALDRAVNGKSAATGETRRSSADGKMSIDADDDPLNGGDVQICAGCINRERKRAARKKSKKPEEEEPWQKDEAKRVIVFNTNEVKEWQEPSASNPTGDAKDEDSSAPREAPAINLPDGAMQIDVPMRIACYCRHKSEKMGFQVILTIKDHEGKLVAQTITNPIMITDDHKTHAPPAPLSNANALYFDQIALPGGSMIAREPLDNFTNGLHRNAHSTNDLQALQTQFNPFGQPMIAPFAVPQNPSQNTSTTLTPRNLSRQASPTDSGNANKKRKGSGGAIRLPDSLQMTRMQGVNTASTAQNWAMSAGLPTSPHDGSPYMSHFGQIGPVPMSQQSSQFHTNPTSPDMGLFGASSRSQSFENLTQMRGVYSQPSSSHPSRAGSPSSAQAATVSGGGIPGSQIQNAFAASAMAPASRTPVIHKLIPNEGPKAGGIEVTCLGSGFSNGLEIMFGDCLATTTTFWGETSLVCLLPPASRAGTVPVTFKHQYLQMKAHKARFPNQALPRQHLLFKYIDDDEQELLRQALLLLNHKMHGTFGEVTDIARSIVNGTSGGMGSGSMGSSSMDGNQMNHHGGTFDAETAVLKCLELIDLDDSPYEPRLNMRRKNGQSILHLAASLGYTRLVAGLLARGANPDVRDVNGLSPMHMAAINGHAGIATRLRRARGDPFLRSLLGFTPADMAVNEQVLEATQALSHARSQSLGVTYADRSRTSSISSTVSRRRMLMDDSTLEYDYSDESDDEASEAPRISSRYGTPSQPWARSRRNSMEPEMIPPALGVSSGNLFPAAAMNAWRDSLAAQIQQFHQSVSWNFPNLPNLPDLRLPNLPSLPTIPENYQAGSMVRRFSSLVPQRTSSPASESDARSENKETVSRVWDLLTGSGTPLPAPPAYEEIYPATGQSDMDTKTESATRAAADAAADQKCAALFDQQTVVAGPSTAVKRPVHIRNGQLTEAERQALVAERQQRMKKLKSDQKLFFIWIPILLFVVLAVLKNKVPQLWQLLKATYAYLNATPLPDAVASPLARVVEVE